MDKQYYTPRQIANEGLIHRPRGSQNKDSAYQYVIRLIKNNNLKVAKNYGTKTRPYFLVDREEIKRYRKENF